MLLTTRRSLHQKEHPSPLYRASFFLLFRKHLLIKRASRIDALGTFLVYYYSGTHLFTRMVSPLEGPLPSKLWKTFFSFCFPPPPHKVC